MKRMLVITVIAAMIAAMTCAAIPAWADGYHWTDTNGFSHWCSTSDEATSEQQQDLQDKLKEQGQEIQQMKEQQQQQQEQQQQQQEQQQQQQQEMQQQQQ